MTAILSGGDSGEFWSYVQVQVPSSGANRESEYVDNELRGMLARTSNSDDRNLQRDIITTLPEKIYNKLSELKILFSKVSMHLSRAWRDDLFAKLDDLLNPEDWDESDLLIDESSFMTFLRLILETGPKNRMNLGVSNEGNMLAGWVREGDQLTLEFAKRDEIFWSIIQEIDGRREIASGQTSIGRLGSVLSPYSPEKWFAER